MIGKTAILFQIDKQNYMQRQTFFLPSVARKYGQYQRSQRQYERPTRVEFTLSRNILSSILPEHGW